MNVVILAGGAGTRLFEETEIKPKPMVEIGDRPILWHIMRHYYHFGFKNFFIAIGYRGEVIKRYFLDCYHLQSNLSIDFSNHQINEDNRQSEKWTVNLIDTGKDTMTGGRLKRLQPFLNKSTFMLTYGDGVSNINLKDLFNFHKQQGKIATLTAVRPPSRFGSIVFKNDEVIKFNEKPLLGEGWINGGFMVFEPQVFQYLDNDDTILEHQTLERLANERQLAAYKHDNFWQCMDTLRDKRYLEKLWREGKQPWIL